MEIQNRRDYVVKLAVANGVVYFPFTLLMPTQDKRNGNSKQDLVSSSPFQNRNLYAVDAKEDRVKGFILEIIITSTLLMPNRAREMEIPKVS